MPTRAVVDRARLAELAASQDSVVTRMQLRTAGVGEHHVRARLSARKWQAASTRVVVLHNGPLTERQRWWVAVLSQPQPAALAGLTAAQLHGLRGFDEPNVHVLVAKGARKTRLSGVTLHESRRFTAGDVHLGISLPSVRVDRALVDGAVWSRSPRRACGVLAAGVQQRLTTPARLRASLREAGKSRHGTLLRRIVGDIEGGAQSFAEIDFVRLARLAGLPPPSRQVVRVDGNGIRRYLDADFEFFCVEVDGAVHLLPLSYWDDMARQNELVVVTGKPMLRFSTVALRIDAPTVVRQLARAAARFAR